MSGDDRAAFQAERAAGLARMADDREFAALSRSWFDASARRRYSYQFDWLGLPIIQYPQDIVAMQEIVWRVQPQLIIETGVARGGSLVLYASLLAMLGQGGRVLGIDIDIRPHNRTAIEAHPLAGHIDLLEGSSVADSIVEAVHQRADGLDRVLVVLDSNHTHEHVAAELAAYADLVSRGSYLVVYDTVIEDLPADAFPDRPWGHGDNPKTAVREFLARDARFAIDRSVQDRLQLTVAPDGYLVRLD